jgi:hypothetical protein
MVSTVRLSLDSQDPCQLLGCRNSGNQDHKHHGCQQEQQSIGDHPFAERDPSEYYLTHKLPPPKEGHLASQFYATIRVPAMLSGGDAGSMIQGA